ncbi:MAG: heavy-metal-associated domain-containing protein [Bacteroidetes bacterium]|nr:heavy-metal-associated domain-containing protein [Bacteroidota bacterium]
MKLKTILAASFLLVVLTSCSNNKVETENTETATEVVDGITTSTFKVWGNCEMCKETIEGSLKVDGITKADWNVDSKIITVSYDDKKISLDQIQKNIASVGYDNEKYKGDDKAYSELPGCCQYDRK